MHVSRFTYHAIGALTMAAGAALGMAVWVSASLPHDDTQPAGTDRFTIDTPALHISVEGSRAAMDANAPEIITRLESVDPALIRPGIGLWAAPRGDDPVLIGHVVSVEPQHTAL